MIGRVIGRVFTTALLVCVAVGCDSTGGGTHAPSTRASTSSTRLVAGTGLGRAGCAPPTPIDLTAGNELQGTMTSGQLYGIAMGYAVPPRVGQMLKIVWRMTGRGPLRVAFTDPEGHRAPLTFGPEAHPASTYQRPGDEWGTGFDFDRPGCWQIHLARNDTRGDVWLQVN